MAGSRETQPLFGDVLLPEGVDGQSHSNQKCDCHRPNNDLLQPSCGLSTSQDVLGMQRGWLGLAFAAPCHPLFSFSEVFPAKKEAAVLCLPLPFFGTCQEPSMYLRPGQIGVDCCDQGRKFRIKVIV